MDNTLLTGDGLKLHVQSWPIAEPARGTVLVVHGFGEHSGRYAHVAAQLNGWGWNAVGYDHRGHGRSEGPRGRLTHSDDLLRDLGLMVDAVRSAHPGPLALLGHSMGGITCARFVAEGLGHNPPAPWYREVDALVLSSPAFDPGLRPFEKLLLAVMSTIAPNWAIGNGRITKWISRDPRVIAAYLADPLVHDRISAKLVHFMIDSGHEALERAARWKVPTLLMFAGRDRCVAPAGNRAFAAMAPKAVVTAHEFGPLFHEIFNEPEQADVFSLLGKWLASRGH